MSRRKAELKTALYNSKNHEAFRKVHFVPTLAPFVVKKEATIKKQI
jgi:hypothetical protein